MVSSKITHLFYSDFSCCPRGVVVAEKTFIKDAAKDSRLEVKRYGYRLEFLISADGVACSCSYEPATTGGTPLTESELQGFLAQFKITTGLIPEAAACLLNSAASGKALDGLLLAQGELMVPGEDSYIDLAITDDLAKEKDTAEDDGTVDLRRVQSFLNVDAGDLVARVHPPGAGTPGMTVSGKVIAPLPGTSIKLELGQNVRLADDGATVYAEATGRVYCHGNEISVEDIYEIAGDVDFKVGNIAFKGFVEVKGDVLDGFTVKATKGIKVHGIIGVCSLESDGDVFFSGMNGQGKGQIRCGGVLSANFIYDTAIECAGDIAAEIEIRNCQIRSLGAVRVNKGGLAGGECIALGGIESGSLGNVSSLRTRVVVGVHYSDLEELNQLFNELKELIAGFSAAPKGTVNPQEFAKNRTLITERIQEVRTRMYDQCNPKINVRKMMYDGVNITLGMLSDNIREERKGPFSVIENTIEGGFRFLGMTALSFKASAIEKTFIQQKQLEQNKN